MKTNKELLAIAKKQLGNNGAKYRKFVGVGGSWCDMFVYWLYAANGCESLLPWKGNQRYYCPASLKWCQKNLAQIPQYLAMECDPIYFDWDGNGNPNHIGIVEKRDTTNKIYTIEGNTSGGKVDDKHRKGYTQAVFRPHFKGEYTIGAIDVDGDFGYNSIANLQHALNIKVDGVLGKQTVRALQKLCRATEDGAWSVNTSIKLQKFLKINVDGQWGEKSTKALQKWINEKNKVVIVDPMPIKDKYNGEFPDLILHGQEKIANTAIDLAYSKGTPKKTYTYPNGHATLAFRNAINKVYPNRSSWSKQCRAGASCDVGAGTVIRFSGIDKKIPRGLAKQIPHLQKSKIFKKTSIKKTSSMRAGDVGIWLNKGGGGHIWIGIGNKKIAEANHTAKYFLHIDTDNYTSNNRKLFEVYRSNIPIPIVKGDRGTQVKRLQLFLNWSGCGALKDDGECGEKTLAAIKNFQKKTGLNVDGCFGTASLKIAKEMER